MQNNRPKLTMEDIRSSETIKCESCGSVYFREVIYLKRISRFVTMEASDIETPFPIYKCDECGHINKGFNPFEESKDDDKITLND